MASNQEPVATRSRPPTTFHPFKDLPTELKLKIWRMAANSSPRVLDLRNGWKSCEKNDHIFYIQFYKTLLAARSPSIRTTLASTCRLSREEVLKAYAHEYLTRTWPEKDAYEETPAAMYINYSIDMIMPSGHWNSIGFDDFMSRVDGRLERLALDIHGRFWKELQDSLATMTWRLNGLKEVFLYMAGDVLKINEAEQHKEVGKRVLVRRDLSFVELEETEPMEVSEGSAEPIGALGTHRPALNGDLYERWALIMMESARRYLELCFDSFEKQPLLHEDLTPREVFKRPRIKLMNLLIKKQDAEAEV
ncbi:uncharacterized protein L3040_008215 [Drepanopeziza brunnea f. sp. 'multigermtubi']|uniref:uncharacterized protein n=1 Tax=Drepanopeziza brunnea f. sp. 'multigermtubi' TaxID=698441 RepID=UPI0023A40775|nr:hypothetical protein L3040_008215 [Drepanopeziza brunnea f. sp. 'multigermtubi']